MLNIEQQITNWRNELISCEAILPENIDELEDHLRTDIDHLLEKELSTEEAFFIAIKRMGGSINLSHEFRKVNAGSLQIQRIRWMIYGLLLYQLLNEIWIFFAEGVSLYTMTLTNSTLVWSLFSIIAICFPISIWAGIKHLVRKGSYSKDRLALFSLPMMEKRKIAIGLITVALILIPIFKLIIRIITYRLISVESIGIFNQGLSIYKLAIGILLPILWMVILQWLERQRQPLPKT